MSMILPQPPEAPRTVQLRILPPLSITPRLGVGLQVGQGSWITLAPNTRFFIDMEDHTEFEVTGYMPSPMRSRIEQIPLMFTDILGLLLACVESRQHAERNSTPLEDTENGHLFPENVGAWAERHQAELEFLSFELEQKPDCCWEVENYE